MLGLSNSQVEEFSAIKKYPSEKVINLLRHRDKIRKISRDAACMVGDIEDVQQIGRNPLISKQQLDFKKQHVIRQVKTIDAINKLSSGQVCWLKKDKAKEIES